MSERTIEQVRAEIETVEARLEVFEWLVEALENNQLLLSASAVADAAAAALPGLRVMAGDGDRRAEEAAEDASEILRRLQGFLPDFAERRRCLSFVLRRGLIPSLYNRRYALQQGLAKLQLPEPEAVGLLERVVQAAQSVLSFGHPA